MDHDETHTCRQWANKKNMYLILRILKAILKECACVRVCVRMRARNRSELTISAILDSVNCI